jgi:tetratricopeptide (TPR) repeat protein
VVHQGQRLAFAFKPRHNLTRVHTQLDHFERSLSELLRIIREEEAPTPSEKLTKLGDTAIEIARCRRTDPVSLRRQLAGDLNWIVMKALEKDRRRRYASVSEFAADIRRHLEDHPVLVSPPGKLYRMRKFVRRHKVSVSAGLFVALSLVAGLIAVGWEARVAELRRREAEAQRARANSQAAQAELERNRAEEKAREADEQRREAEELFGGVRDLANSMIFNVADQIAELQGATAARETLVRKAVEYLDRLSKHPRATPELRMELGEAYMKIGDLQGRPGRASLDDPKGAAESYRRSIALLEPLAMADPNNPKLRHLRIQAYLKRGSLQYLPHDEGQADLSRALTLSEDGVRTAPKSQEARHDLALSLHFDSFWTPVFAANPKRAEETVLKTRSILEDVLKEGGATPELRPDLAMTYANQASIVSSTDSQRALQLRTTALQKLESLSQEFPFNAQYRRDEALARLNMAWALTRENRTSEAIEFNRAAISLQQQLVDTDRSNASLRSVQMLFRVALAEMLNGMGNHDEAQELFRQVLAGQDRLVAEKPDNPQFRFERAYTNYRIGSLAGDPRTGLDYLRKAQLEMEEIARQNPGVRGFVGRLADAHDAIGRSLLMSGDPSGALVNYRRKLAICERLAAGRNRGDPAWGQVGNGHRSVAVALRALGDHAGALEEERKAVTLYERVITKDPESFYRPNIASAYTELAAGFQAKHNWAAVIENAGKAVSYLKCKYAKGPSVSGCLDALDLPLRQLADAYRAQGDLTSALEIRRRLVEMREEIAALSPPDPKRAQLVAHELGILASDLQDTGDRQGCLDATLQAIAILDRFPPEKLGTMSLRSEFGGEYLGLIGQLASIHEVHASLAAGRKVLGLLEDLYRAGAKDEAAREWLDSAHRFIALLLMRLGSFAESLQHYQQSLELQPLARSENAAAWRSAADLEERVAVLRGRLGDRTAMEEGLQKAIELDQHACMLADQAWKNSPKGGAAVGDLHGCEAAIMRIYIRLGDPRQALEYARKAIPYYPTLSLPTLSIPDVVGVRADAVLLAWQLAGDHADYTGILELSAATPPEIRYFIAHGYRHLGSLLADDGLWQPSMDAHQKSAEILEALLQEAPRNKDYQLGMALAEQNLGQAYLSNAQRTDTQKSDLDRAHSHLGRARRIVLDLEAERVLPDGYHGLPGQLASDIAVCETLLAKK